MSNQTKPCEKKAGERRPIVVVGSVNIDLVARIQDIPAPGQTVPATSFETHPGGKGANQAGAVAHLGYPVRMIGRIGDDSYGERLRSDLEQAGVEVSGIITTPGSSGMAMIMVAESGENCIVVVPGANWMLTPLDLDENAATIESAGMVLTQLELPLETVEHLAEMCKLADVPLMLDPAPARTLPQRLLDLVTWFTPNEAEATFYSSGASDAEPAAIAQSLLGKGIQGVVLKLGARGAWVQTRDSIGSMVAAYPIDALDTTAAGDAFNGAFATALMRGMSAAQAGDFAAAAAAISVTRIGAQSSMATLTEVEDWMALRAGELTIEPQLAGRERHVSRSHTE